MKYIYLLIFFNAFLFAGAIEQEKYLKWSKQFKETLSSKHNIDSKTLDKVFKNSKLLEKVIFKDKNQLHTKISFSKYMKLIVSKSRIKKGKQKFSESKDLLLKTQKKYGVDAKVITALWGVESYYSKLQGKYVIIDSLLSLIYDGRRAKFFTKELINAIKILKSNNLEKTQMKGSWAGAMGANQFMPSTYVSYAVDGDKDGVRDIWKNKADIFPSIANLIKKSGYKSNQPIAVEINPIEVSLKKKSFSLSYLEKLGMKYKNNKHIKGVNKNTKVTIKKYDKRYFLIFDNFKVIKRWNNSDFFAISVAMLSQSI